MTDDSQQRTTDSAGAWGAPRFEPSGVVDARTVAGRPVVGRDRSPVLVAVLSVVTLGLYLIYWWYVANREMRDFARSVSPSHPLAGSSPGLSTVAVTLGGLIVVPVFVTAYTTARRVGETGSLAGLAPHDRPSPALYMCMYTIGALLVVLPFLYAPLLQSRLNRTWLQARADAAQPAASDWLTSSQRA